MPRREVSSRIVVPEISHVYEMRAQKKKGSWSLSKQLLRVNYPEEERFLVALDPMIACRSVLYGCCKLV